MANSIEPLPSVPPELAYPAELRAEEQCLLAQHRIKSGQVSQLEPEPVDPKSVDPRDCLGVALSGGGVRSATFALGVFQSLAKAKVLHHIEYLSGVSGGGYFAGFFSSLYRRSKLFEQSLRPENEKELTPSTQTRIPRRTKESLAVGEILLGQRHSGILQYLRDNGRYLAPAGSDDVVYGAAVLFRNWIAVLAVLLTFFLAVVLVGHYCTLELFTWCEGMASWSQQFETGMGHHLRLSPWLMLPLAALIVGAAPLGWGYWSLERNFFDSPWPDWAKLSLSVAWYFIPNVMLFGLGLSLGLQHNSWDLGQLHLATQHLGWGLCSIVALSVVGSWIALWMPSHFPILYCGLPVLLGFLLHWGYLGRALVEHPEGFALAWFPLSFAITAWLLWWKLKQVEETPKDVTTLVDHDTGARQVMSQGFKVSMVITVALAVVGVLDSTARSLFWAYKDEKLSEMSAWLSGGVLASLFSAASMLAQRLAPFFSNGDNRNTIKLPISFAASAAAGVAVTALLLAVDLGAHMIIWHEGIPMPAMSSLVTWMGATIFLSMLFGSSRLFLNRSTHHALYAARLTRCYLGASNPKRYEKDSKGRHRGPAKSAANRVMPDDDFTMHQFLGWPKLLSPKDQRDSSLVQSQQLKERACLDTYRRGGPLHLINVTLNETVDGRTQMHQADRKGMGLSFGPCAVSLGIKHHAVLSARSTTTRSSLKRLIWQGPGCLPRLAKGASAPPLFLPLSRKDGFRVFDEKTKRAFPEENLSVGQWIGISGAAFSTGLGSRTNLGMSILAGLSNIRLGYWWRPGVRRAFSMRRLLGAFAWVQTYMLRELFARFPGTANYLWYLSDGGHFENMGAYELIRRRLKRIIIVDGEADSAAQFEGLANLVRKARIDFGANIVFQDPPVDGQDKWPYDIGPLNHLRRGKWTFENDLWELESANETLNSRARAAVATICYPGDDPDEPSGLLLYVKPTLLGNEAADLLHYHTENPSFPHETTIDQFFDEAQWESYRKLGEITGDALLHDAAGKTPLMQKFFPGARTEVSAGT